MNPRERLSAAYDADLDSYRLTRCSLPRPRDLLPLGHPLDVSRLVAANVGGASSFNRNMHPSYCKPHQGMPRWSCQPSSICPCCFRLYWGHFRMVLYSVKLPCHPNVSDTKFCFTHLKDRPTESIASQPFSFTSPWMSLILFHIEHRLGLKAPSFNSGSS